MSVLLGLDIGTSNTKAIAFSPDSRLVEKTVSRPTPYVRAPDGSRVIDAEELWRVVETCLRELTDQIKAEVLGLGIASMAEAGVPLDAHGHPLYPIIPWYDPRTEPQLQRVLAQVGPERLFQVSGQAMRNVYSLFKLLWLREHEPTVFTGLHRWLSVADYAAWRLTGAAATDFSLASRTMLFDQRTRTWSPEMLELAGLDIGQLPRLAPAGTPIGTTARDTATSLAPGIPVVIAGHDHLSGALGVGAVAPGMVADSIGTAESLVIPTVAYHDDDRLRRSRTCCYANVVPGQFVVQAGITMGGGALEWLAGRLFSECADPVDAALAAAAEVPVGSEGLFYFPYLGGNGAPVGDENVSGCFIGLRPTHERGHLCRALLEGVAFGMRNALEVVEEVIGPTNAPIRAFGGGSRSSLWLGIRASVLGREVIGIELPEAVAVGAALLAGVGAGIYSSADAATLVLDRPGTLFTPRPNEQNRYEQLYRGAFVHLYPALAPVFQALSQTSGGEGTK